MSSARTVIVVLNWNGKEDTLACLRSLEALEASAIREILADPHLRIEGHILGEIPEMAPRGDRFPLGRHADDLAAQWRQDSRVAEAITGDLLGSQIEGDGFAPTVDLEGDLAAAALDAGGSSDADGDALSYDWALLYTPGLAFSGGEHTTWRKAASDAGCSEIRKFGVCLRLGGLAGVCENGQNPLG